MRFRVRVEKPDLSLPIDLRTVANNLAVGMRDHWADMLDQGRQPTGEPLPPNAEGKPLGRGQGTLIRRWVVRSLAKRRGVGRAYVEPYRQGKYKAATYVLAARGLLFQSFGGESRKAFDRLALEVAGEALDEALTKKKRRRRGRIKAWKTHGRQEAQAQAQAQG